MRSAAALPFALAIGIGIGCASQSPAVGPDGVELAQRPFTAEQIREATKVGRTYVYRVEPPDRPPLTRQIVFTAVDDVGCTTRATTLDGHGRPMGDAEVSHTTWPELVAHASWPKTATTIAEGQIEVPAGKFDCVVYRIEMNVDGARQITVAHFAKNLPGAPVSYVTERDGVAIMSMTLLEHRPGQ